MLWYVVVSKFHCPFVNRNVICNPMPPKGGDIDQGEVLRIYVWPTRDLFWLLMYGIHSTSGMLCMKFPCRVHKNTGWLCCFAVSAGPSFSTFLCLSCLRPACGNICCGASIQQTTCWKLMPVMTGTSWTNVSHAWSWIKHDKTMRYLYDFSRQDLDVVRTHGWYDIPSVLR